MSPLNETTFNGRSWLAMASDDPDADVPEAPRYRPAKVETPKQRKRRQWREYADRANAAKGATQARPTAP